MTIYNITFDFLVDDDYNSEDKVAQIIKELNNVSSYRIGNISVKYDSVSNAIYEISKNLDIDCEDILKSKMGLKGMCRALSEKIIEVFDETTDEEQQMRNNR